MNPFYAWLETISLGQVISILTTVGAVILGLKWLKPIIDSLRNFIIDWAGEPARPGVPARLGVMATLAKMQEEIKAISAYAKSAAYNTKSNRGESAHDNVIKAIRELSERLDQSIKVCSEDREDLHEIADHYHEIKPLDLDGKI